MLDRYLLYTCFLKVLLTPLSFPFHLFLTGISNTVKINSSYFSVANPVMSTLCILLAKQSSLICPTHTSVLIGSQYISIKYYSILKQAKLKSLPTDLCYFIWWKLFPSISKDLLGWGIPFVKFGLSWVAFTVQKTLILATLVNSWRAPLQMPIYHVQWLKVITSHSEKGWFAPLNINICASISAFNTTVKSLQMYITTYSVSFWHWRVKHVKGGKTYPSTQDPWDKRELCLNDGEVRRQGKAFAP